MPPIKIAGGAGFTEFPDVEPDLAQPGTWTGVAGGASPTSCWPTIRTPLSGDHTKTSSCNLFPKS